MSCTDLILRSALLRASRRMAACDRLCPRPSFETAAQGGGLLRMSYNSIDSVAKQLPRGRCAAWRLWPGGGHIGRVRLNCCCAIAASTSRTTSRGQSGKPDVRGRDQAAVVASSRMARCDIGSELLLAERRSRVVHRIGAWAAVSRIAGHPAGSFETRARARSSG